METEIRQEEIPQGLQKFYAKACELYQKNVHYTEFSNTFFRQDSELMKRFKTKKERETFLKSPLYRALQNMKEDLLVQQELDDTINKLIKQEKEEIEGLAKIKVVGVGGGGGDAVKRMIEANLQGVEFYVVNTDLQALKTCRNAIQVPIGTSITHGLGAYADSELGRRAAEEDKEKLTSIVEGADMVFVIAGMGGGTGTGASPIIAELAREAGALTISVVTRPFTFEGKKRARQAEEGILKLGKCVDTQIVIPNQRLIDIVERKTPIKTTFRMADEVLLYGVKSILNLITISGEINVDFADVRTIMKGVALMGIGRASGDERSRVAAEDAITCPLLEDASIEGATGVLVNVTGPVDMRLHELDDAMDVIYDTVSEDADVIFGLVYDEEIGSEFQVTVIAAFPKEDMVKNLTFMR